MDPIRRITLENVTRSFGRTIALRGVSVAFAAGEVTTLEGHNGSGKSTLLGILGTLITPTSGRVLYGDEDEPSAAIRQQIGWVSHESHCYPDLSAEQNLSLTASLYGVQPDASDAAIRRFGVERFADFPVRQLSRGQKQRVALARAMVHSPSVLLLDEPTTGLDVDGIERLIAVVQEEAARGCVVIFVTHDIVVAERIATKRVRLERGRLVA